MVKQLAALAILLSSLVTASFGQTTLTVADIQRLNEKIVELYKKGDLESVIELAKKVSDAERSISGENSENYAAALTNLAAAEKEAAAAIRKSLGSRFRVPNSQTEKNVLTARREARREAADNYAASAEKNFTSVLGIYGTLKRDESAESAAIQGQLAWLTYAFRRGTSVAESRAQIDRAELLYSASLAKFERLNASSSDAALRIRLDFADFYYGFVNFERALPLYTSYVSLLSAKNGNDARLASALRKLKAIADITLQESEAKTLKERLAKFTDNKAEDTQFVSLVLRSRKIEPVEDDDYVPQRLSDSPADAGVNNDTPEDRQPSRAVIVEILVDEKGDVIEAKTIYPVGRNKKVEAAALASKFRPFLHNGVARKMRGTIVYRFRG